MFEIIGILTFLRLAAKIELEGALGETQVGILGNIETDEFKKLLLNLPCF